MNLPQKYSFWDRAKAAVNIFDGGAGWSNPGMSVGRSRKIEEEQRQNLYNVSQNSLRTGNPAQQASARKMLGDKSWQTNPYAGETTLRGVLRDAKASLTGSDFRARDKAQQIAQQQKDNLIMTAKNALVNGTPEQKFSAQKLMSNKSWAVDNSYKPAYERNVAGDALNQARYGIYRSGVGSVQGAAGLYDWLSPGHGTSRLSKSTSNLAANIDKTVENMGIDGPGYHMHQFFGDALTFMMGSAAFKGLSYASKIKAAKLMAENPAVAKAWGFTKPVVDTVQKPLNYVGDKIDDAAIKMGTKGRLSGATGKALTEAKQPYNLMEVGADTGIGIGQMSARGEDVSPVDVLTQASLSSALNVGLPFTGHLVKNGLDSADNLVKNMSKSAEDGGLDKFNPLTDTKFNDHFTNYKKYQLAWEKETVPALRKQLEDAIQQEFILLNKRGQELMNSKGVTLGSGPFGEAKNIADNAKIKDAQNKMLEAEAMQQKLDSEVITVKKHLDNLQNELDKGVSPAREAEIKNEIDQYTESLFKAQEDAYNVNNSSVTNKSDKADIRETVERIFPGSVDGTTGKKLKDVITPEPKTNTGTKQYSQRLLDEVGTTQAEVEKYQLDPYQMLRDKWTKDIEKKVTTDGARMDTYRNMVSDLLDEGYSEDAIAKALVGANLKDIGDGFELKNRVRAIAAQEAKGQSDNPSFGGVSLNDIKARKGVVGGERPRVTAKEAETPKEAIFNRLMELGLSHKTAVKLLNENNSVLENTIFNSANYIKKADNPDAYANKIIDTAKAKGRAALNQNAPVEPEVKTGGVIKDTIEAPKTVENTKPRIAAKGPETEVRKAADILSRTMDEQEYTRVVDSARTKEGLDHKLNYMRKILQNNLERHKQIVGGNDLFDVRAKDDVTEIARKDTGEIIGEFSPNNTYDEMLAYAEAARVARDVERGVPTEPIRAVNRSENVMEQGPELKTFQNAPEQPQKPFVSDKNDNLGNIVKDFYDNTKEYTYDNVKQIGDRVVNAINREFKSAGLDFATVARKVDQANWEKIKNLSEAGLTVKEAGLYRKVLDELDAARTHAGEAGKVIGEGDQGSTYFPRQRAGTYDDENALIAGFKSDYPGNEISRRADEYALTPGDVDYSPEVIGDYVVRYGDGGVIQKGQIEETLGRQNLESLKKFDPETAKSNVSQAADVVLNLQNRANEAVRSLFGGVGKQRIRSGGEKINLVDDLSSVGSLLGKTKAKVTGKVSGLRLDTKLKNLFVGDEPLWTHLGIEQHREANNFAATHVRGDNANFRQSAIKYLDENYSIAPDRMNRYKQAIAQIDDNLDDSVKQSKLYSIYSEAAKEQMVENLQKLDITDPKAKELINRLGVEIMREGTIRNAISQKIATSKNKGTNAIFRKLSISTALNEFSDITTHFSALGKEYAASMTKPSIKILKEFDIHSGYIDPATEAHFNKLSREIDKKGLRKGLRSAKKAFDKGNDMTNFYRVVEWYKTSSLLSASKKYHSAQGLKGDDLTRAVLNDYYELGIPQDMYSRTFLDDYPFWTQYMSWGAKNISKEFNLLKGNLEVGKYKNMTKNQRIARNLAMNVPAKTMFWLTSNGIKGAAILTAFGLTDFTGATNQDYSGVADEDKNWYERNLAKHLGTSTTMSIISGVETAIHKGGINIGGNQIYSGLKNSQKYKDANYNPYEDAKTGDFTKDLVTPQFVKNIWGSEQAPGGAEQLRQEGYKENRKGRVQYESPESAWDWIKAYAFGPSQTNKGREYSGKENVIERTRDKMAEGGNAVWSTAQSMYDMAREDLGLKDNNYTRPLTDTYSDEFKKLNGEARTAMLEGGRQYNKYLDDLKKNNEPAYNSYIKALDGNHVNPEYWNEISKGGKDLTNFKMIRDRKRQLKKDLGEDYDPIYKLTDEQARAVLEVKSVATGDDIALNNALYKQDWYKKYKDDVSAFWGSKGGEQADSDFKSTDRVKEWYGYDKSYNALRDYSEKSTWKNGYPLVYQYKNLVDKYGYDSQERKNWHKANYDAWVAEKEKYDKAKLELINKMRAIEGVDPMSYEQFQQVSNVKNTDKKDGGNGYSKWGSSGRGFTGSPGPSVSTFAHNPASAKIQSGDEFFSAPGKLQKPRVASRKISKPKVTLKKSKV